MTDLNQVVIVGRLTRDAELKYTNSGLAILDFSIAVNRSKKDGDQWVDEASFFECSMMGKSAESISRYMVKGHQIVVSGSLRQDRWESDGQKRSKVKIHAYAVQLVGEKKSQGPSQTQQQTFDDGDFQDDVPF